MKNEIKLISTINKFKSMIQKEQFVIDKTGVKTVELISYVLKLNPLQPILNFTTKKTNVDYCTKELNWYLSNNLSINGYVDDISIWKQVCTKDEKREVNSNYGWCVFDDKNFNQYKYAIEELKSNPNSRRAVIMYNRPSMTKDYNRNGMSDYICTISTTLLIRNGKLIYNIHQRSCDFIYGFFNDFYWHCFVYSKILNELNLKKGHINYYFDSLHVYERHFELIKNMKNI